MSPSWRRRLLLGLAPDGITALRFTAGLRPRVDGQWTVKLDAAPDGSLDALAEKLAGVLDEVAHPKEGLAIVLSNHWVRYAVIPGDRKIRGTAEQMALAGIIFEQQYGPVSREWELRVGPASPGHAMLASGVSRPLLAAVCASCAGKVRLQSIRPALMSAFNRVRRSIGTDMSAIAVVESGRITLAHCRNGEWTGLLSRAVEPGDGAALQRLLSESTALQPMPSRGVVWVCDLVGGSTLPVGSAWQARPINPPEDVTAGGMTLAALAAVRS